MSCTFFAGRHWLRQHIGGARQDEATARGLLVAETNTSGGSVSLALPPGRLVLAAALPRRGGVIALDEAQDLTASIAGSQLSWQAPAGEWFVVVMTDDLIYEGTHAAISLAYKKPCIDLLTPEPTARFLEVTHARYAEKLGPDLGRYFVSTFTDEPSLQSFWFRPMPYRVLPWSLTIEREFGRRRGRELRPLLPALVAEAGPAGARARYDFWNTVGELVSENYFGQIQTWCHKHNLLSGGHLLMEEGFVSHVPLYGDFLRCARQLGAPSMDCLTSVPSEVPWYVARLLASVTESTLSERIAEADQHTIFQIFHPIQQHLPIFDLEQHAADGSIHGRGLKSCREFGVAGQARRCFQSIGAPDQRAEYRNHRDRRLRAHTRRDDRLKCCDADLRCADAFAEHGEQNIEFGAREQQWRADQSARQMGKEHGFRRLGSG